MNSQQSNNHGSTHKQRNASRRQFTKRVAATLVVAPLAAQTTPAQTAKPKETVAPPNPNPTPAMSPIAARVAEAYADAAQARFGEHLNDAEFARVRRDLEGNVRSAERLRGFKLANSDEPDFIFKA